MAFLIFSFFLGLGFRVWRSLRKLGFGGIRVLSSLRFLGLGGMRVLKPFGNFRVWWKEGLKVSFEK